jgi:hypothetical protein
MDEVADLLNHATQSNAWSARSTRRFLSVRGAAEPLPDPVIPRKRRTWVTTRERLREVFPAMYEAILRSLPEPEGSTAFPQPSRSNS